MHEEPCPCHKRALCVLLIAFGPRLLAYAFLNVCVFCCAAAGHCCARRARVPAVRITSLYVAAEEGRGPGSIGLQAEPGGCLWPPFLQRTVACCPYE
ncbi:MAG: hypothetical protein J3K34DRAFT_96994 [Monoraphidium minutum]|nr:MAG: hypothetical protein J3K34DRAFT_96994 [Monoraphidium minutum]